MIQVYADGNRVYDSRMDGNELVGLTITSGLNEGGTATIVMSHGHPAYYAFTGYKTEVTIYRDDVLRFRGRAIYHTDTYYGQRTITCEGEMCFLRDTINRPYKYEASPRSCFVTLINSHNSEADAWKRFKVGEVTVEDPNNYIKLESQSAETTLDTLNKLLERCGGYITYTTDTTTGERVINWLADIDRKSGQVIEFGENLLDFTSTGANTTSLVTALIPYGAQLEGSKDGKRLTIESVNHNSDVLLDLDAVSRHGKIYATVTWDDVTTATALMNKAKAYLEENKTYINSLELTALDLSCLNKTLDSFAVGDMIRVVSKPHGVNEEFQLSQLEEDLLNPANSRIIMGKDLVSLTGADVAGDYKGQSNINAVMNGLTFAGEQISSSLGVLFGDKIIESENKANETYVSKDTLADMIYLDGDNRLYLGKDGRVTYVRGTTLNLGDPTRKTYIDGSDITFLHEARFYNGSGIRIFDNEDGSYYVLRVDEENSCVVGNDYTNLFLRSKGDVKLYKGGITVTSDRREKNSIEELPPAYEDMLDMLTPVRYRYNGKGDRYHVGFVAQDVERAMTEAGLSRDDFGGFVDQKGDGSELALSYDEFIGLLLQKIRGLENRLKQLEEKQ